MSKNAPFFSTPERQQVLTSELRSWHGTRFKRESGGRAKKGIFADCVSFIEAVLFNVGAISRVQWPPYLNCGGGAAMRELMLSTMDAIPEMGRVWWPGTGIDWQSVELVPGDVFVRSAGDDSHHMAIYGGDLTLWHCMARCGVGTASVRDTFAIQDLQVIYRVYETTKENK